MKQMRFCPQCGNKSLRWDGEKKWDCPDCDFVLFHNCAAAVAVVVKCGEEILLTRRNQEPGKGKLDLAGGFSDPGESAEETCARELREELKLEAAPRDFKILCTMHNVYHYKGIDYNTLDIFFELNLAEKPDLTLAEEEIGEVLWLKKSEIKPEEIAFESQKKFFREYLAQ